MWRDLRAVIGWLPGRARTRWLLLLPLMAVTALLEAAGALAVFGLLRLVVDPNLVDTTPVVSSLRQIGGAGNDPRTVVAVLALAVGIFYLLRAAFIACWTAPSDVRSTGIVSTFSTGRFAMIALFAAL